MGEERLSHQETTVTHKGIGLRAHHWASEQVLVLSYHLLLTLREGKALPKSWVSRKQLPKVQASHLKNYWLCHCNYFQGQWNTQMGYTNRSPRRKAFPLRTLNRHPKAYSFTLPIKQKHRTLPGMDLPLWCGVWGGVGWGGVGWGWVGWGGLHPPPGVRLRGETQFSLASSWNQIRL